MVLYTYEQLATIVEEDLIPIYHAASWLSFFKAVDIGDIDVTTWYKKYVKETMKAALTRAGFNPNRIKLDFGTLNIEVYTSAQDMQLSEKDFKSYQKSGLLGESEKELPTNVAETASMYLWAGTDPDGNSVDGPAQYNYIKDAGSGNGTPGRPNMAVNSATNGAWSTVTNMYTDLSYLVGTMTDKNYPKSNLLVCYPNAAEPTMTKAVNTTTETTPLEYLVNKVGLRPGQVVPVDNVYMKTAAGAAPTKDLFDLYCLDISKIDIGYTRRERFRLIPPIGRDRNHYLEGEVWFVPAVIPQRIDESGTMKTYKGVGRITAIATS